MKQQSMPPGMRSNPTWAQMAQIAQMGATTTSIRNGTGQYTT